MSEEELLTRIYSLLYRLGLTASYTGFFHTARAVLLACQDPENLTSVTKRLYPETADQYGTNWHAVERNIRYCISVLWKEHPNRLSALAGAPLDKPPTSAKFISLLTSKLTLVEY